MSFLDFDLYQVPEADELASRCFGGGAKNVLIILATPPELREETEAFVAKVFAAAAIDIHKDALLLYVKPDESFNLAQLSRQKDIRYVLAFGVPTLQMSVPAVVPPYQPVELENLTLLLAHDITAIAEERQRGGKQLSGALWNGLKLLFKL